MSTKDARKVHVITNGVVVVDVVQLFVVQFSQLILRVLVSLVAVIGRNLILTNCFLEVSSNKLMN